VKVVTGIDLPYGTPGGSVELLRDLYLGPSPLLAAQVFMLDPGNLASRVPDGGPVLLPVDGKSLDGPDFWTYVDRLIAAVRQRLAGDYDVVHLQHLAFGATPALQRVFADLPQVAVVHGTDLLYAETHPTQAEVLRHTLVSANAVVVPTAAMADQLARHVTVERELVVHIPWGVPDQLLRQAPPARRACDGTLRILYAGRLTAEKATASILIALAALDGVELSVAAPAEEYARLASSADLSRVRYLGWYTRRALWREFAEHDLLVIPSLTLEAFGLVAVEAQACGLPIVYNAVPGLSEVLLDSALAVDFRSLDEVAALIARLRRSPALLNELHQAGRANSARFPLSATASALHQLSIDLAA